MRKGRQHALLFFATVAVLTYLLWPGGRVAEKPRQPAPALLTMPADFPAADIANVRVNLTPTPASRVDIEIVGPFHIRPVGNARDLGSGRSLVASQANVVGAGFKIGAKTYAATRIEIVPENSPAIWINGHQYRGTVQLFRHRGGTMTVVNVLPLEQYIASVVNSEMPAAFPTEARKAQAIVARTYVLYQIAQAPAEALFDVYADTRSQKYLGYQYREEGGRRLAGESASSREIALQTRGMVCTYGGRLFCTYYSAVCGGHTLRGAELFDDAVPAVTTVPCDHCREAKYYRWEAALARGEMEERLRAAVNPPSNWGRLESLRQSPPAAAGQLPQFEARYQRGQRTIRADRLRSILSSDGVRSPQFVCERQGERFVIHGRGHGHGAGLCQWGAQGQAKLGRTARQIVQYYYPGAELVVVTPPPQ